MSALAKMGEGTEGGKRNVLQGAEERSDGGNSKMVARGRK
jgi:hypothetical protein